MVLKLYGNLVSTCTQTVLVVLKEKNVPHEFVKVDFTKGEHKAPDYLARQPFGQLPAIDNDGFELFESRAIAKYIATKYAGQGTKLLPEATDVEGLAKLDEATSIEVCNFMPSASGFLYEKMVKPMIFKQEPDEAAAAGHLNTLNDKLDAYEKILSKQKYLAGNEITLADLYHLPKGARIANLGVDLADAKRPNVARWWKEITARSAWQEVVKLTQH